MAKKTKKSKVSTKRGTLDKKRSCRSEKTFQTQNAGRKDRENDKANSRCDTCKGFCAWDPARAPTLI